MTPESLKIIPVAFVAAMLGEYLVYRRKGRPYPLRESGANLSFFAIRNLLRPVITVAVVYPLATWVHAHRLTTIPIDGALPAFALFVSSEFVYYWYHRWSHEIRLIWAEHAVHHSSNSMNLTAAARISWLNNLGIVLWMYQLLTFIGFSPVAVGVTASLGLAYQFWLHTELVPRLPLYELVFNSPSLHRVHHASNVRYLDVNYGGVLIVFDRLFGTYVPEDADEPCIYGLTTPETSLNPLVIQFREALSLLRDVMRHWRNPRLLAGYVLGPPGWSHDGSRKTTRQLRDESAEACRDHDAAGAASASAATSPT